MADIDTAELPACPDCVAHDGGWSGWCDECHVLAREELRRLRARLADVEALHVDSFSVRGDGRYHPTRPGNWTAVCVHCGQAWPCQTAAATRGEST